MAYRGQGAKKLVVLFGEVMKPLGGRALLEEMSLAMEPVLRAYILTFLALILSLLLLSS